MSFANELIKNFDSNPKEKQISHTVNAIVSAACESSKSASYKSRSVCGYYTHGWDSHELTCESGSYMFVYETDWGGYKDAIKRFGTNVDDTYARNDPALIVQRVKEELVDKGFSNPIVRYKETNRKYKYGYSSILLREKYITISGFIVYVELNW